MKHWDEIELPQHKEKRGWIMSQHPGSTPVTANLAYRRSPTNTHDKIDVVPYQIMKPGSVPVTSTYGSMPANYGESRRRLLSSSSLVPRPPPGIHFVHRFWGQKAHDYHVTICWYAHSCTELNLRWHLQCTGYARRCTCVGLGFAEWILHAS